MNWTRIWFGQLTLVVLAPLMTLWTATQYVADVLAYQPQLGAALFTAFGYQIYAPWNFLLWWFQFDAYAPEVFETGAWIALVGGPLPILISIGATIYRARDPGNSTTYGSARWATVKDVKKAKLFDNDGIFLGAFDEKAKPLAVVEEAEGRKKPRRPHPFLRHDGPEHALAFAPTRSGKGVGLVVPTLLTWPGSVLVHDLKQENWELTAGFRSTFSHCVLFNPTSQKSACYNPLLEIRRGMNEIRDVQNVADIIVDPDGSLTQRTHWDKTAHSLLSGAILHVLYAEEDKTLYGVTEFLSHPDRTIYQSLLLMLETKHLDGKAVHPVVAQCARELMNKSANELSGVLSTALSLIGIYRDPLVRRATATSDFRILDLMEADAPVSLYLAVPPSDLSRTKPLMRLILNQVTRRLTEELDPKRKHKLLLMLDEFPAFGRLEFFETGLAFLAGYGIRAYLIAQSLNQLDKAYGPNHAIMDNCHLRVAFATNDDRTAKRVSDSLGTATEKKIQQNYAGHRISVWLGHRMVSTQETGRQLATPGEITQLPDTDALITIASVPPIYARKVRYYEEPSLMARILPAPVLPDDGPYPDRPPQVSNDWSGLPVRRDPPKQDPAGATIPATDDTDGRRIEKPPEPEGRAPEREVSDALTKPAMTVVEQSQEDTAAQSADQQANQRLSMLARAADMSKDDLEWPL
jgi:type IV secretion system protein VirD4